MSRKFNASIANAANWSWDGEKPEDANAGGGIGKKQRPIFKRGDRITLRVQQIKGPHKIVLTSTPYSARTPFAYPFDLHSFVFDPDVDELVCAGPELLGSKMVWTFDITPVGGVTIDPELQVGPGGHPPDRAASGQ